MEIEIQDKQYEAILKNGKYQFTFNPKLPTEKIKIHHMGCVGDTRLNHIQLEQGTEVTTFVAPDKKVNSLSGIFKQLRDLDVQLRDQTSELWGKIKLNNAGAILDFYDKNIKTELSTLAGNVNVAISELDKKVLKKSDVTVTSNGITLGSGKTIDGRTIASIMKVQPDSIDLISPLIRVTGDMVVDGTLEGRKIKVNTLETGHHKAGSITTEILAANAVKADKVLVDNAMINKFLANSAFITELFAKKAFINQLQTVKITSTQLDTDWLSAYTGDIGGFRIGKNPNQPGDFWLTGSNNFNCGLNPGHNIGTRGAQIWAAWGNNWSRAGTNAWWVDGQGRMTCSSPATFYGGLHLYNARLDAHGQDIQGDSNNAGVKTTVIWWSQIERVKSSVSDKRFKTSIKPTKVKAVELLNKIEMVEFNWIKDNKFEKIGAIAQQVQLVEESLVVKDMDSKQSHSDYLRISYYDAIPYLIKAVQELSEENKKIKKEMEKLKYAR